MPSALAGRVLSWQSVGLHSYKRHRLAASCGFYQLDASCQQVTVSLLTTSSCSKSVKIRLVNCNLMFADLLLVVETTCIKLVDKKPRQSTCSKPVDDLRQTCYHQAGASDLLQFALSGCVAFQRL